MLRGMEVTAEGNSTAGGEKPIDQIPVSPSLSYYSNRFHRNVTVTFLMWSAWLPNGLNDGIKHSALAAAMPECISYTHRYHSSCFLHHVLSCRGNKHLQRQVKYSPVFTSPVLKHLSKPPVRTECLDNRLYTSIRLHWRSYIHTVSHRIIQNSNVFLPLKSDL